MTACQQIHLGKAGHRMDYSKWKTVFKDFADLGWMGLLLPHAGRANFNQDVTSQGACRFHDHSDVFGWVRQEVRTCPFPEGAPVAILNQKDVPILGSGSEALIEEL